MMKQMQKDSAFVWKYSRDCMRSIADIDNKISLRVKLIIETIVVLLFAMMSVFIARYHEPWLDEAQSYLLGRDASVIELVKLMRYEETPILWFLIIKIFILLGGTYRFFFVLPVLFSTLGVAVLEYKVKAPLFLKILFPFTYFIAFQYTTIIRSYTMVLLAMLLVVVLYNDSVKKPILYTLTLLFLQQICAYTFLLAGSFYLLFIVEICKKKLYKRTLYILSVAVLFVSFLFTAICLIPANDSIYISEPRDLFDSISQAFYLSDNHIIFSLVIAVGVLALFAYSLYMKGLNKLVYAGIIILPVLAFMQFVSCKSWHIGILFITMMTLVLLFELWDVKYFSLFLLSVFVVQIAFTAISMNYDYHYNMCSSKEASQYISQYVKSNALIRGIGGKTTAIEAYYDSNIFENHTDNFAYVHWSIDFRNNYNFSEREFDNDCVVYVLSDDFLFCYIMLKELTNSGEMDNYPNFAKFGEPKKIFLERFEISILEDPDFVSRYIHVDSVNQYDVVSVRYFPGGMCYKDHVIEDNGICVIEFNRQIVNLDGAAQMEKP